jgi:hypothetical protein
MLQIKRILLIRVRHHIDELERRRLRLHDSICRCLPPQEDSRGFLELRLF